MHGNRDMASWLHDEGNVICKMDVGHEVGNYIYATLSDPNPTMLSIPQASIVRSWGGGTYVGFGS